MSTPPERPIDPHECRLNAQRSLGTWLVHDTENGPRHAMVWALLAIAGELAAIGRGLRKHR
ncbi:hypothetical protein [Streptomyces albipurpureus]|uniref:Uncharacterized protein n=1 Tax=Streptomyces albipurpureus TaxID=2897419 RepID=A0ABT0UP31_9ACTN|nr:hypothetical protein [Streptomyces sp. CWNU-1]MCM2390195.1 hypothetical protein [Streptomyces sp. CWNU-1]